MSMLGARDRWLGRWGRSCADASSRRKRRPRLLVELLEDRCVPSTITVTSLSLSPPPGAVSLSVAIQMANSDPGADTIVFAPGLTGTISLMFPLTITAPLTIQGMGAASTAIQGEGGVSAPDERVFDISASAGDVTLDGLTLTSGHTNGDNQNNPPGTPGDFTNNGGAIKFLSHGTLTIRNSVLTGNHTSGQLAGGGAIFAYGGAVVIDHSTLTGNHSNQWRGGAVYSINGPVTLTNSTLSGNVTGGNDANGGAIFSANGSVTITNCTLAGNHTDGTYARGGAIFVRHDIPSLPTPAVTITNSTLSGNFTRGDRSDGGAIYTRQDTNVTLIDSTISNNTAQGVGGAIFTDAGKLMVLNSTIAGNVSHQFGGGIFGVPTMTVRSSIIADNNDSLGPSDLGAGSLTITNSLIGLAGSSLTPTGPTPDANGNLIGSSTSPIDPLLGPLQNNGGPTQTRALLPGSPAIDRGANSLNLTTDQRGFARVFGAQADMGAFERQDLVVTSAADRMDTAFDPTNLTLRDAVALANSLPGADTITFAAGLSGMPVRLGMGELAITESMTIQGLGAAHTTIDAQGSSRIFNVSATAGDVTLDGLNLTGGRTSAPGDDGGAILFNSPGTLTVQNSILTGNASAGLGGAIANVYYGDVMLSNSTLSDNSTTGAAAYGGAIFSRSPVRITNSTVAHNSTQGANASGGGIFSLGLEVINSTIANNFTQGAAADGGGIFSTDNLVTLSNSTIWGNSTTGPNSVGGGIFDGGGLASNLLTLRSSIIAGNHDSGTNPDLATAHGPPTVTNSLIGNNTGTGLAATGTMPNANGNLIGSAASPMSPLLGPLRNNGGPTPTLALLPGSPAINRGANPLNLATDQRGLPRVVGAQADMGAFEVQVLRLLVLNPNDTMDTVMDPNNLSLRDAVALANNNPGPDTITLDPSLSGVPLLLSLGDLLITDPVTVQGLGAANTVIDAQQQSRIFDITAAAGDVTLDGLTLTSGQTTAAGLAGGGGAIHCDSHGTLTLQDCVVSDNATLGMGAHGGGIFTQGFGSSGGALLLRDCTVSGNSTQGDKAYGGGICGVGPVTLLSSTISGNSVQGKSSYGGGIEDGFPGLTLTDSTVADNSASDKGGGIADGGGPLTMTNSTVAGNSSQTSGGGILAGTGPDTIRSSIIAGNTATGNWPDLNTIASFTLSNSLIGSNQGTSLTATGPTPDANGNLIGFAADPLNPLLGPLQNNGGPTLTLAPLPGSPALGRGSNPLGLTTDQRLGDFARQVGGAIDMGAVEVQQPPPPPLAHDDHVTVLENSGPNPLNVVANDSGTHLTVTAITQPLFGQAVILPGGVGASYQPNRSFDGSDQFTYTVSDRDGRTSSATIFINVSGANIPPLAQPDSATVLDIGVAGSGQTPINVLANDSGNHLRIVAVSQGSHGTVLIDPLLGLGLSYMANAGFRGSDSFTYIIRDDLGRTATANVSVTVVDTSMPMAHDDTVAVPPNSPNSSGTSIDVLANDTGRVLQVTAVTQPTHGTVTLLPTSLPVYQPNPNYLGPDSFTYTITDDMGHTSSATVNVMVLDPAVLHIQDQTATAPENGGPVGIDLLAHDTGMDLFVTGVTQPAHGTVQPPIVDHRTVSYTPAPDFAGTDMFAFTVLDGNGQTVTAHVTVTVVGPSAPLAAQDDTVVVPAGSGPNPINVLGNDTGSGVHVTAITQGSHGAAVILPAGEGVTYQPNAGFTGTDQFTYTVTDANGQTATATVRVTTVANFFPIAQVTGLATGQAGQALAITVSASDISADPAPGFTYVVNWGDGGPTQTIPASPGNGAGVMVSHVYAVAGSYTVQVTAVNQDGNTSPVATTTVTIAAAPITPQPVHLTSVFQSVGKGKHRRIQLFVQVAYSNGQTRLIPVPFTKPRYRAIMWVLADLDGDGVRDAVVFTARLGKRKVTRVITL